MNNISHCSFKVELVTKQEVVVTVNGNTKWRLLIPRVVVDMPIYPHQGLEFRSIWILTFLEDNILL